MLSTQELEAARDTLRNAEMQVAAVRGVFLVAGFTSGAAAAHDIGGRLGDLIREIEKLIAQP